MERIKKLASQLGKKHKAFTIMKDHYVEHLKKRRKMAQAEMEKPQVDGERG